MNTSPVHLFLVVVSLQAALVWLAYKFVGKRLALGRVPAVETTSIGIRESQMSLIVGRHVLKNSQSNMRPSLVFSIGSNNPIVVCKPKVLSATQTISTHPTVEMFA